MGGFYEVKPAHVSLPTFFRQTKTPETKGQRERAKFFGNFTPKTNPFSNKERIGGKLSEITRMVNSYRNPNQEHWYRKNFHNYEYRLQCSESDNKEYKLNLAHAINELLIPYHYTGIIWFVNT